MTEPVIVPRADHTVSRRDIDPDALKVLYRLREHDYIAYLVGGSVRDLMLGRRPKDFDIGTDAHPYQIKKLFRNCWIIGRRFRLAHVKFGQKTIEVATFRKNVPESPSDPPPDPADRVVHRDNTFGTPEEDAFRRDFTINGLFYNIADHSVIDYVGGLADLEKRVLRSIGDPRVRFVEDPVRMLRAAVLGARLDFELDEQVIAAIAEHGALIATASPARLTEEYYKILRSGYAEASFRALHDTGLLALVTPELASPPEGVWQALAQLDAYRRRFPSAPPELTNAILIGGLLAPLGIVDAEADAKAPDRLTFGMLPVARRDLERLRHLLTLTPRLAATEVSPRVRRSLPNRPAFDSALVWIEIFGDPATRDETLKRWSQVKAQREDTEGDKPPARRRRRRRRRRRPAGTEAKKKSQ